MPRISRGALQPFFLVSPSSPWQRTAMRKNFLGFLALLLASGCSTPKEPIRPLTEGQLRAFFAKAKDPRSLWITVYESKAGPVFTGGNRLHPEQAALLDFVSKEGSTAPLINVENGPIQTFKTLVDTSSKESWMSLATAQACETIPLGPPAYGYKPQHVVDPVEGYLSVQPKLRFDQLNMESALVCVKAARGPLGPVARGVDQPAPAAVLGCNLLKSFQFFQINYPERAAVFSSTVEYGADPDRLIASVPFREVRGAYAADGVIDGEPKTFIVDSAGDFTIAMTDPPTNALRQVSLGDLVFRNVEAEDLADLGLGLPDYPRIGRQLLSRFRVTFANKQGLIVFERPASVRR